MNPKAWREYPYSSIWHYVDNKQDEWLLPTRILEMFDSHEEYIVYVKDYEDHKRMLDELKYELANIEDD